MLRCTGCSHLFHPACCGYPATLTAAEAEAMRPPFACFDHAMFFPRSGQGIAVPVLAAGPTDAVAAAPETAAGSQGEGAH